MKETKETSRTAQEQRKQCIWKIERKRERERGRQEVNNRRDGSNGNGERRIWEGKEEVR